MNKRKTQFTNMLLLLTLNGINVFGMNEEIINETQMSTELNKIYEDFTAIQEAFQKLYSRYYTMLSEIKNSKHIDNDNILETLNILRIIKEQIENKKQFANKIPTKILMTNITLRINDKEKEYNLFLEEGFFKRIIDNTHFMFFIIINNSLIQQSSSFKKSIDNKRHPFLSMQNDTIKVFASISQYLKTIEKSNNSNNSNNYYNTKLEIKYLQQKIKNETDQINIYVF